MLLLMRNIGAQLFGAELRRGEDEDFNCGDNIGRVSIGGVCRELCASVY